MIVCTSCKLMAMVAVENIEAFRNRTQDFISQIAKATISFEDVDQGAQPKLLTVTAILSFEGAQVMPCNTVSSFRSHIS